MRRSRAVCRIVVLIMRTQPPGATQVRLVVASLLITLVFFSFPASLAAANSGSKTVHCGDIKQRYVYFNPEKNKNADANHALPAVVLLHGAGDIAENMISAWKKFAGQEGIVLLAPELPRDPKFEDSAPKVFRCVVEDARRSVDIDSTRVYLFGNSMGGYLAYDGAMFQSNYFAAIAVHAMRIADDYTWIVGRAERKTPISIYIGDHDQFFKEDSVRQTRDLLRKAGFPVRYVELRNHDHNYYAVADQVNEDAWKFFKENPLPAPSK
jgi:dienelactone hydrolase